MAKKIIIFLCVFLLLIVVGGFLFLNPSSPLSINPSLPKKTTINKTNFLQENQTNKITITPEGETKPFGLEPIQSTSNKTTGFSFSVLVTKVPVLNSYTKLWEVEAIIPGSDPNSGQKIKFLLGKSSWGIGVLYVKEFLIPKNQTWIVEKIENVTPKIKLNRQLVIEVLTKLKDPSISLCENDYCKTTYMDLYQTFSVKMKEQEKTIQSIIDGEFIDRTVTLGPVNQMIIGL